MLLLFVGVGDWKSPTCAKYQAVWSLWMAKGHRCCARTQIPCHCNFRRSHPICYGYVDKSSHPLKQNFNQLPLWELLFCPGVSSLVILLKCKLFGVEIEAICSWLSVSAFMAPCTLMSLMFVWGIHTKRELNEDSGISLWIFSFLEWQLSNSSVIADVARLILAWPCKTSM